MLHGRFYCFFVITDARFSVVRFAGSDSCCGPDPQGGALKQRLPWAIIFHAFSVKKRPSPESIPHGSYFNA